MRLVSWNVNGLRAVLKKGFLDWIAADKPAVLCLQETRIQPEQVPEEITGLPGYRTFWAGAEKKGYSGVGIMTTREPENVRTGLGIPEFDREGRVITAEFADFFLVNAYFPNSQHELKRLDYKLSFNAAFLEYCNGLRSSKPVVFCGDLNVAHQERDLANPERNRMNPGFYIDEREWFSRMLEAGYIDTFRMFEQQGGFYSWWSYRFNARMKNIGWRIDYFIVSMELGSRISGAGILSGVYGSDHCPVFLELSAAPERKES